MLDKLYRYTLSYRIWLGKDHFPSENAARNARRPLQCLHPSTKISISTTAFGCLSLFAKRASCRAGSLFTDMAARESRQVSRYVNSSGRAFTYACASYVKWGSFSVSIIWTMYAPILQAIVCDEVFGYREQACKQWGWVCLMTSAIAWGKPGISSKRMASWQLITSKRPCERFGGLC